MILLVLSGSATSAVVSAKFTSQNHIPVTAASYTATGNSVDISLMFAPQPGAVLTLIKNTGISFISGRFSNLFQGQLVTLSFDGLSHKFVANYYGGTGNDLVLEWYRRDLIGWGANSSGQLGTGTTATSHEPVAVLTNGALANKTVLAIAAGTGGHCLALCSDGSLAAWGNNTYGQLGVGSTTSSSVPVTVPKTGALTGKIVVAIAAGFHHSLALCSDGSIAAWGYNHKGQLGNGGFANSSVPVAVSRGGVLAKRFAVAIAAEGFQNLVLCTDGSLASWGDNAYGQLGNNSTVKSSNVPVAVDRGGVLAGKSVSAVAVGGTHALALCTDGNIASWGSNYSGRLGNNSLTLSRGPVLVNRAAALAGKTPVAIAAGTNHSLAHCSDGTLVAWGAGSHGQIGNNTLNDSKVPVGVNLTGVLAGRVVSSLAAGNGHSLVTCTDGTAAAWGLNQFGQLGDGGTSSAKVPVAVNRSGLLSFRKARSADAGNAFSIAFAAIPPNSALSNLVVDGASVSPAFSPEVLNYHSRLPIGNASITIRPTAQSPHASITVNGVAVASGSFSPSIPFSQGSSPVQIVVTAENGATTTYRVLPPAGVNGTFSSASVIPVTASSYSPAGKDLNLLLSFLPPPGTQLTVVENTSLDFIDGRFDNLAHGQVVALPFNGRNYKFIANYYGGSGNDLVLMWHRRELLGWGSNSNGLLGMDGLSNRLVPIPIPQRGALLGKDVLKLETGFSHSIAICSDGSLAAWGSNSRGQLGDGTTNSTAVPVDVYAGGTLSGKTVIRVAAGYYHNLALCSDGTLVSWGVNLNGELGNGTYSDSIVPVPVDQSGILSGKSIVAIAVGYKHSLALCSDGTMASWGDNWDSQLGLGFTGGRMNVPTQVQNGAFLLGKSVASIAAGYSHNLVLCSDNTLASWGGNLNGQLGNGQQVQKNLPVAVDATGVLSGRIVKAIRACGDTNIGLCEDGMIVEWGAWMLPNSFDHAAITRPRNSGLEALAAGGKWSDIAAGAGYGMARRDDGAAFGWGNNSYGQLGNGAMSSYGGPAMEVERDGGLANKPMVELSTFSRHTLAITALPADSSLSALRIGSAGLSPGFDPRIFSYASNMPSGTSLVSVTATASSTSSTIRVNGVIQTSGVPGPEIAFGKGSQPILVEVTADDLSKTSYTISPPADLSVAINSPDHEPMEFDSYDSVGFSINITLGHAPAVGSCLRILKVGKPGLIAGQFDNLKQGEIVNLGHQGSIYRFVANYYGGSGNDLVLEWANRSLASWGAYLGDGTNGRSSIPVAVDHSGVLEGKTVVSLSSSSSCTLALCADGTLAGWGSNLFGQLGLGEAPSVLVPVVLNRGALLGKKVVAAHTGSSACLALCSDGSLAAWGGVNILQFATGSTEDIRIPMEVPRLGALAGKEVVAVSVGSTHFLVLCSDGSMVSWGTNAYGELGSGVTGTTAADLPVQVVTTPAMAGKTVISIGTGIYHSAALCSDGTVFTWGLKPGASSSGSKSSLPEPVGFTGAHAGKGVVSLAVSSLNLAVMFSDGSLAVWGSGSRGQIGNYNIQHASHPSEVYGATTGRTMTSVAVGHESVFATSSDGNVLAWGWNSNGQLGLGDTNNRTSPALVSRSSELYGTIPLAVASGGGWHTHAILALPDDDDYIRWASGRPGLTDKTESGDPDADGIPNLVEYVLNGDPARASTLILPRLSATGDDFIFRFNRLASSAGSSTQVFQYSSDMQHWTDVEITTPAPAGVMTGEVDAEGNQPVSVTIPRGSNPGIFGRLKIERP